MNKFFTILFITILAIACENANFANNGKARKSGATSGEANPYLNNGNNGIGNNGSNSNADPLVNGGSNTNNDPNNSLGSPFGNSGNSSSSTNPDFYNYGNNPNGSNGNPSGSNGGPNGTNGNPNGSTSSGLDGYNSGSNLVDEKGCIEDPTIDYSKIFRTSSAGYGHISGDMNRRNLSHPVKKVLSNKINPICLGTNVSWGAGYTPSVSSDKPTRDLVCRLHGYARATGSDSEYGYYKLASPGNDYVGFYDPASKSYRVNRNARKAPTGNKILVWTGCEGKLQNKCEQIIKNKLRCFE